MAEPIKQPIKQIEQNWDADKTAVVPNPEEKARIEAERAREALNQLGIVGSGETLKESPTNISLPS